MTTIHLSQTTTATPGQFVAGLTDFGPGRSKLFGNAFFIGKIFAAVIDLQFCLNEPRQQKKRQ